MTIVQMHPMSGAHASEEKKMKKTRRRRKKVVKTSAPTITEERRNMIKGKAKVQKNEKVTVTKPAETDSRDVKTKEELHDLHHRRTLFVRFPYRVKDKSVVNQLHHGIETVRFKHRINNWCHVRFVSEEVAKMALKKLHNMKLEKGGKLFVAETKKGKINKITNGNKEEKDQKEKKLRLFKIFVKDLPESVTKAEIRSAFPKCAKIRILPANIKKKSQTALVGFRNVDDMKAVVAERIHRVREKEVHVDYSKSYLNLSNQELQKNTSSKTAKISKQNALVTPKSLGKMVEASLSQLKKRDNVAKETQMDTSENMNDSDSMGDESENEGINMVDVRSKTKGKLRTANAGNYSKPKGRGNINIGQDDESDYEFNDTDDDTHNQDGGSGDSNDSEDGDDSSDNNDGEGSEDSNDDSNDESVDDDDDNDDDDDDDDVGSGDNDSSDEGSDNEDDGSDEDDGSSGDSKDADVKNVK